MPCRCRTRLADGGRTPGGKLKASLPPEPPLVPLHDRSIRRRGLAPASLPAPAEGVEEMEAPRPRLADSGGAVSTDGGALDDAASSAMALHQCRHAAVREGRENKRGGKATPKTVIEDECNLQSAQCAVVWCGTESQCASGHCSECTETQCFGRQ